MRFNQGGSTGGENVDCSGLDLVHLDDIITDMRIGNFIRVRTNGQPRNIKLSDITGMNLADNKLTDGDNLKEFLSYLPRNGSHLVYLSCIIFYDITDILGVKFPPVRAKTVFKFIKLFRNKVECRRIQAIRHVEVRLLFTPDHVRKPNFIKPDNSGNFKVFDIENILQEPYSPSKRRIGIEVGIYEFPKCLVS